MHKEELIKSFRENIPKLMETKSRKVARKDYLPEEFCNRSYQTIQTLLDNTLVIEKIVV